MRRLMKMKVMKTKDWTFLGNVSGQLYGKGFLFQHKKNLEYVIVRSAKIVTHLGFVLLLSMRGSQVGIQFSDYTLQTHPGLSNSVADISSVLQDDEQNLMNAFTTTQETEVAN
jgi:membrane-associated PAP2 superfamily phosphatase